MKSKAQILVEEINKRLEEKGLPIIKEEKKQGYFVYIPGNNANKKEPSRKENK